MRMVKGFWSRTSHSGSHGPHGGLRSREDSVELESSIMERT